MNRLGRDMLSNTHLTFLLYYSVGLQGLVIKTPIYPCHRADQRIFTVYTGIYTKRRTLSLCANEHLLSKSRYKKCTCLSFVCHCQSPRNFNLMDHQPHKNSKRMKKGFKYLRNTHVITFKKVFSNLLFRGP